MTTVVEHQGGASRSHSRQSSRESSRSSSEVRGVRKSNRKSKPKVLSAPAQNIHASSPNVGVVAMAPDLDSACAGFQPGIHDDDELMNSPVFPAQGHVDQRSIQQHHHVGQTFVDQRSVHQHVHIEDELARREAHEARVAALQVQAEAQRAVIGAEQAAQNIAIQANLEVNRVVEAAHSEVNRVIGDAASENEQWRQQNIQQQQMIEALQVKLQQQEAMIIQQHGQLQQLLQSRNSADFVYDVPSPNHATPIQQSPTSSSCRPPRIPTPKAPSEASNVSAELQAHMTNAVKALGQQIGESMKSMQDQINQLAGSRVPQTSSPISVVYHGRSHQAFATGDPGDGGDGDDDDGDTDDPDEDEPWADQLVVQRQGLQNGGAGGPPGDDPPGGNGNPNDGFMPGGAFIGDENNVYRGKDLSNLSVPSLPKDASAFRGWRNSLIAKLSSIDRTGLGVIMRWVQTAFEPSNDQILFHLENFSDGLPRLDAWLAGQLSEPKHMTGNIGMRFQGYLERAQLMAVPLKGRRMLHEVAKAFALDRMRGSQLTQQALLELPLDSFAQSDLRHFYDRVEFILNSIQPNMQPSEQTKYIFLFERLKRCHGMRRHIDKIRDSAVNSHRRTFAWLWCRFGEYLDELKEDANQESVKKSLTSPTKPKDPKDTKGPTAALASSPAKPDPSAKAAAAPPSKAAPKPPPKHPKGGDGKAKGKGKGDGKAKGKEGKGQGGPKDSKPRSKAPCIFFPQGTCNRGDSCPFSHDVIDGEPAPKGKAQTKATAAPKVKTAAAVAFASLPSASASSESIMTAVVRACTAPLRYFAHIFACVVPVLHSSVAHTQVSESTASSSFCVDWIADSGAGRSLGSVSSLEADGIPSGLIKDNTTITEFPIDFATGGGARRGDQTIGYEGDVFGHTNAYLLPKGCPLVRSLGEIVNQQDRPFIWLPGELPFFATSSDLLQIACSHDNRIVAHRIEENVPIFRENIKIVPGMPSEAKGSKIEAHDSAVPSLEPDEGSKTGTKEGSKIGAPASDADSEGGVEWITAEIKRARSIEHRLAHFPKSSQCLDCKIAKCYKKRVSKKREYELLDRGLDPVTAFGERIAVDFIVVSKTAESKTDHYVLMIRDEWSGFLQGIPMFSRDGDLIVSHIKKFLGPRVSANTLVCKADVAKEFQYAAEQLGAYYEPTLERYWPHNSRLERDIRTFQESVRATHLSAGFAAYPSLWPVTVQYCTVSLALGWNQPDVEPPEGERHLTRLEAASGQRFDGPHWLLGQLVYYRVSDRTKLHKFSGSCVPGIFAGWRLENGCRYRGVVLILDYEKVRTQAKGFENLIAVPQEEVVFDDHLTLPLKVAHRESLTKFSLEDPSKIPPISIPFSDEPIELPAKTRAEYITLDRLIKYGGTDNCRGCEMLTSRHTKACRDRFNRLIRADKPVPVEAKPRPLTADAIREGDGLGSPTFASRDLAESKLEEDLVPECPPDLVETASSGYEPSYLPEAEIPSVEGMTAAAESNQTWSGLSRVRRLATDLPGVGVLYEYACSGDSLIGNILPKYDVKVVRLSEDVIDLSNFQHVLQLVERNMELISGFHFHAILGRTFKNSTSIALGIPFSMISHGNRRSLLIWSILHFKLASM